MNQPILAATGIWKKLGDNEVLKGIDLLVQKHEVVSLMGPSGAGKSTLLRCCNLLERPDSGDVRVGDVSLTSAHPRRLPQLRTRIGMVFQSFNLFPNRTALDNVALAPRRVLKQSKEESEQKAHELLVRVGLGDRCSNYPRQLSGGQQQRVAIARALAMDPEVMLFDEPTSALDAETVREVLTTMQDLSASGMTMVVVSHEVGFVKEASDRVLFLDQGRVLEESSPVEFFGNPQHERAREFVSKVL